jgi:hypothetical protein
MDCTAGAFEMSANKLLVADDNSLCGKHWKLCSGFIFRQAGKFGKIHNIYGLRSGVSDRVWLMDASASRALSANSG